MGAITRIKPAGSARQRYNAQRSKLGDIPVSPGGLPRGRPGVAPTIATFQDMTGAFSVVTRKPVRVLAPKVSVSGTSAASRP